MLPTAGQFKALGKLFEKGAEQFPDMLHEIIRFPFDSKDFEKSMIEFLVVRRELSDAVLCGELEEECFNPYNTQQDSCIGYLIRPTPHSWNTTKAFVAFNRPAYAAGNLLRQIPDHLNVIETVDVFHIAKKECENYVLWLVFLHEFEQSRFMEVRTPDNHKHEKKWIDNVFLKSSLACEYLADRLESVKQPDSKAEPIASSEQHDKLENPVSCVDVGGVVHRRPDSVARTLKAAKYPVVKRANKNYCDPEHAAVLFPKWKAHLKKQQEDK